MFVSTWPQNMITEIGYLIFGGALAAIPILLLGLVLNRGNDQGKGKKRGRKPKGKGNV